MTFCIHCELISHTYRDNCTLCSKKKDYHFFFSLPEGKREKLLKVLSTYHQQSKNK